MNKSIFLTKTTVLTLGALLLQGQSSSVKPPGPIGETIKRFALEQRNPETGELQAMLRGEAAKVVTVNRTEITNMAIEIMNGDKINLILTSPQCNYWHLEGRLSTNHSVKVLRDDMEIDAQNMEWDYKERKGVLRNNVRVVLKGIDLSTPAPASPQ